MAGAAVAAARELVADRLLFVTAFASLLPSLFEFSIGGGPIGGNDVLPIAIVVGPIITGGIVSGSGLMRHPSFARRSAPRTASVRAPTPGTVLSLPSWQIEAHSGHAPHLRARIEAVHSARLATRNIA